MSQSPPPPRTHVVIIDGTMSRLDDGNETNAGLLYKLLKEMGPQRDQTLHYDRGIQAIGAWKWVNVAAGIGINKSIRRGYSVLASRFRPGDRVMLFGYSRGAYAVRSLAGLIARIGLLNRANATERRVSRAFRYYEARRLSAQGRVFSEQYCHQNVPIDVLGVWDTVRALGLPYPILNRLAPMATEFHDHRLTPNTRNGFHALALDENRRSYDPMPWQVEPSGKSTVEQLWFPGAHPDIGGQIFARPEARPLSNIPLVWLLSRAQDCGLRLPEGWQDEFPLNPAAPMHGSNRGSSRFFIDRGPRQPGCCSSEAIHPSVYERMDALPRYRPKALANFVKLKTEAETKTPARLQQNPQEQSAPAQ